MKKIIIGLMALSNLTHANYSEYFGAHTTNSSVAGQATFDINNSANNYYIPGLLAFSEKINFAFSSSSVKTDFEPISSVVTKNSTTQESTVSETTGLVKTDYQKYYSGSVHISLPIAHKKAGSIGLSVHTPMGHFMETDSGDPLKPEYVMYRSRYKRSTIYLNYAHPIGDSFAFSLGTQLGFQASAEVDALLATNGASFGTSAQAENKVKPTLGAIVSAVYKKDWWYLYLTYQQEMTNKLKASSVGVINVSSSTEIPVDMQIETMIYYDPHTFRLGSAWKFWDLKTYATLEYQMWSGYKTPIVRFSRRGGLLLPSSDYESVTTKNILVPKVGAQYLATDKLALSLGASYRPTPLKGDFSSAGNSIDTDSYILATGISYDLNLFDIDSKFSLSAQYHMLEEKKVIKTSGQENGNSGNKIGAPGYTIGGTILTGSVGLNVYF